MNYYIPFIQGSLVKPDNISTFIGLLDQTQWFYLIEWVWIHVQISSKISIKTFDSFTTRNPKALN